MFTVTFTTENAAFEDGHFPIEVARVLRDIADRVHKGAEHGKVHDVNGNLIGEFRHHDGEA